jgi:hypothetical protein
MTDQDVTGEKLKEEIARTEGVVKVSVQIVNIATLLHKAKVMADSSNGRMKLPAMLEDKTS